METTHIQERPILFRGRLVRAILEDRKTQTRRVGPGAARWLKAQKGDRLWVRETWKRIFDTDTIEYRADYGEGAGITGGWKPSIHMPKSACRLWLELTEDPRVEPLQAMTSADILAEGVDRDPKCPPGTGWIGADGTRYADLGPAWRSLWDSINAKRGYGWKTNPNVVVLTFRRLKP